MPTQTKCPLCGKPSAAEARPFCSRGCKDRDLINWLNGRYAVPASDDDDSGLDSDSEARL